MLNNFRVIEVYNRRLRSIMFQNVFLEYQYISRNTDFYADSETQGIKFNCEFNCENNHFFMWFFLFYNKCTVGYSKVTV